MFFTNRMPCAVRVIGGVLLALYGLMVSGLPIPMASELAQQFVRYPCEDSACGCASANQCWKSCCCNTLEEKVAWANENGVVIPDFVRQLLPQASACCTVKKAMPKGCCRTAPASKNMKKKMRRSVRLISAHSCGAGLLGLPGVVPAVFGACAISIDATNFEFSYAVPPLFLSGTALSPATPPPEACSYA
jgi:hypothetical protein